MAPYNNIRPYLRGSPRETVGDALRMAKCDFCGKLLKATQGTSSLRKHVLMGLLCIWSGFGLDLDPYFANHTYNCARRNQRMKVKWPGNQLNNQDRKQRKKPNNKQRQAATHHQTQENTSEGSRSTIAPVERIAEMLARICLKLRSIKDMIEADRGIKDMINLDKPIYCHTLASENNSRQIIVCDHVSTC